MKKYISLLLATSILFGTCFLSLAHAMDTDSSHNEEENDNRFRLIYTAPPWPPKPKKELLPLKKIKYSKEYIPPSLPKIYELMNFMDSKKRKLPFLKIDKLLNKSTDEMLSKSTDEMLSKSTKELLSNIFTDISETTFVPTYTPSVTSTTSLFDSLNLNFTPIEPITLPPFNLGTLVLLLDPANLDETLVIPPPVLPDPANPDGDPNLQGDLPPAANLGIGDAPLNGTETGAATTQPAANIGMPISPESDTEDANPQDDSAHQD